MSNRFFSFSICACLIIGICNLFVDVMEIDAAQYAEMSWEMLKNKNFLQPTCLGREYLDKPPLLFWLSSFSFFLLGVGNCAYKLPSLLFAILAVYSVFKFAALYYSRQTALLAALMLASSQAMFLATNDVRTDTILMGSVIFSIWQWSAFFENSKTKHLLWGSIGLSLSLLAKGPVGAIALGSALLPHLIWKRKWKQLFDWRMSLTIIIAGLMLLPMCFGLYKQHGANGLKFFFWTQSFGRITGESEWSNNPDTFFLLHTFAWMILPWTIFFAWGWVKAVRSMVSLRMVSWSQTEFISISGFTLMLFSLMLSRYQLPHYVYIVMPLGCVIAARGFEDITGRPLTTKYTRILQTLVAVSAALIGVLLHVSLTGSSAAALFGLITTSCLAALIVFKNRSLLALTIVPTLAFNFMFSAFYFPAILHYQASNDLGKEVKRLNASGFVTYKYINNFSLVFYAQQMPEQELWEPEQLKEVLRQKENLLAVTTQEGIEQLRQRGVKHEIKLERGSFMVNKMNLKFLHPALRNEMLVKNYLIEIYR